MTRRARTFFHLTLAPALLMAVVIPAAVHGFAKRDAAHARFYQLGSSVNSFLKDYCQGLEAAFETGDVAQLSSFYATSYRAPRRGRWRLKEAEAQGGAQVSRLEAVNETTFDRSTLDAELAHYLAGLAEVERTVCKINLIEEVDFGNPEQGAGVDSGPRVELTVKFILDGADERERTLQDRHFYRWTLVRETAPATGAAEWKIARDELLRGVRVAGRHDSFMDVDPHRLGIDFAHRRDPALDPDGQGAALRFGVIQHASGGVVATDVNGDGRVDLFFADGVQARLYLNVGLSDEGLPAYRDATAETGLDGLGAVHSALFFDHDNDGDRDLFVGRYLSPSRFYVNLGGARFEDRSAELGLDFVTTVSSATLLDFDRDGFLDLYVGAYGNAFQAVPRLPFYASNGQPNRLFHNQRGAGFRDVTGSSGTGDRGWSLAVAAADINGDGWTDLAVANDFGKKSLLVNTRDGSFEETTREAGVADFSGGMGLTFGDYDGDGDIDLYTSNINSNQRWFGEDATVSQYVRNMARSRWIIADAAQFFQVYRLLGSRWRELGQMIGEGNSLFENRGDGTFIERHDSDTARAGWSWSVAFFDHDNDADLDLYAANGWISATPGTDL